MKNTKKIISLSFAIAILSLIGDYFFPYFFLFELPNIYVIFTGILFYLVSVIYLKIKGYNKYIEIIKSLALIAVFYYIFCYGLVLFSISMLGLLGWGTI